MCRAMGTDAQIDEDSSEKHLRKQLAAAVRKIQWSYAIFWSISNSQPGVLAWTDGFYNGEIKTRKTTQPTELNSDHVSLQRSDDLRELYESLSAGDSNLHNRRPCASLSPEDLTDTEWYYLVCMSFTFTVGQGLPGKAFANDQYVWLNNAQFADCKIFSRSLLAMSASIQTVLCIPFMDGVLEFGTTELILEDPAFVTQTTNLFWELPVPVCSELSISTPEMAEMAATATDQVIQNQNLGDDLDNSMVLEDENLVMESQNSLEIHPVHFPFATKDKAEELHFDICEELNIGSPPGDGSNKCFRTQQLEDLLELNGLNCMSEAEDRRQFMHDEFSNGLHGSLNSNEQASLSFVDAQRLLSFTDGVQVHVGDDIHYVRTLTRILGNSKQVKSVPCFSMISNKSSFIVWRRGSNTAKPFNGTPQKLLKKIIIDGEWLLNGSFLNCQEQNALPENLLKHVSSKRRRSQKLNEKFVLLQTLVPSISKVDKASILGDAIDYLKDLEKRVQELESCRKWEDLETEDRSKHPDEDVAERTSDNYGNKDITIGRKPLSYKRKAEGEQYHWVLSKEGPIDVNVSFNKKEVAVVMHCPWRECLLLEIVESIGNFHLDPVSMQSSIVDGVLALTIKCKLGSTTVASPGMIKRALQRVIGKCL
ncbi:transcription factor EGL1-like isoform X2 [Curcuma longa]|uniref:transcription factor EGL1-like isoform X2 n=1 Tax=Curcuma longa TaxID=136217 RepID=UPI003D9E1DC8